MQEPSEAVYTTAVNVLPAVQLYDLSTAVPHSLKKRTSADWQLYWLLHISQETGPCAYI